jgi:hypothetical protein
VEVASAADGAGVNAAPVVRWFDEVRAANPDVLDVAQHLGLSVRSRRFGPCPACNKDTPRHPPLTPRHGGSGWMCAHCKATGDVVRLAAWVVAGAASPDAEGWGHARAALAAAGWCSGAAGHGWTATPRAAAVEEPYPDSAELWRLLRACRPVSTSRAAMAFWVRRRFGAAYPAAVLPDVFPWPRWWPFRGAPWSLVVSMVDASGEVRSIHARHVEAVAVEGGKTRWPFERNAKRLLFADPVLARPMLRGVDVPVRRLLVVEGITDYLAAASRPSPGLAVVGACSGGFGALSSIRVPSGVVAFVATDSDAAGNRYASEIAHALTGKCADVRRVRLPSSPSSATDTP